LHDDELFVAIAPRRCTTSGMDGIAVSGEDRPPADHGKRIRRRWTTGQKRRTVREAERPGAVRQQVAQRHCVHLGILNRWRRKPRIGVRNARSQCARFGCYRYG
jgi:hypothetical protein